MINMEEKYNWFWGRLLSRKAYIEEAVSPMGIVSVRYQLENQRPILARRNLIQIIRCLQNCWEYWRNESQGKLLLDLRLTPNFQSIRIHEKLPPVIAAPCHRRCLTCKNAPSLPKSMLLLFATRGVIVSLLHLFCLPNIFWVALVRV